MKRIVLFAAMLVGVVGASSCEMANRMAQAGGRLAQAAGRTVGF